jgi:hypothetical protein
MFFWVSLVESFFRAPPQVKIGSLLLVATTVLMLPTCINCLEGRERSRILKAEAIDRANERKAASERQAVERGAANVRDTLRPPPLSAALVIKAITAAVDDGERVVGSVVNDDEATRRRRCLDARDAVVDAVGEVDPEKLDPALATRLKALNATLRRCIDDVAAP